MNRVIVAITGASGAIYGVRTLELLAAAGVESHLVLTKGAKATIGLETDLRVADVTRRASVVHGNDDLAAPIASGSFRTAGMLVVPCSIKSLSGIANCYSDNLVVRAADVTLKERRPLVLLVRETPLHAGHIRLLAQATEAGATVMPPVPAFYARPATIDELITHTVARALDQLDLPTPDIRRWNGVRTHHQPTPGAN